MKNLLKFTLVCLIGFIALRCSDEPTKILPKLSINDATGAEGSLISFTVSLNTPSTDTVSFTFTTQNGSAGNTDYIGAGIPVTVKVYPGETSASISISAKTDATNEDDETFTVVLADAENAVIEDGEGTGTITNVVPAPSYFMKVKIGNHQWNAVIGGFFGAAFLDRALAGYGTGSDTDSQISLVFYEAPTGPKTFTAVELGATNNNEVTIYYSPTFFSDGMLGPLYTSTEGEVVITKYDTVTGIAEGTFEFTGENEEGDEIVFSEGSFSVPIE